MDIVRTCGLKFGSVACINASRPPQAVSRQGQSKKFVRIQALDVRSEMPIRQQVERVEKEKEDCGLKKVGVNESRGNSGGQE